MTREDRYENRLREINERLTRWCGSPDDGEEEGVIEMICDIREQIREELRLTHEERYGVQR